MADITKRRNGELLRVVVSILWDKPDGMQAKEVLEAVPHKIALTAYEKGSWASSPDTPRYRKIVRFATIGLVKAGWMVKSKGGWILTDEGRSAFKKYADPEEFFREVDRLYYVWKRSQPEDETEPPVGGEERAAITFEEAEEKAWEQVQAYLKSMNPYDFQELVADLLRVMGYHVSWIAPPGKDRGVDIIAHTDPLGTSTPRIKVQVKRREESTKVDGLRSFLSVLGTDDVGIFVSTGGFTSDAMEEARSQESRKVTLLDLQAVFDLWVEHYGDLSQDARRRLPLKPIYFLAPEE
ncbi:MAG: restriction endonuclease [Candidatus Aminicenantes bacterium]|nr:restriction endonuclease [Candidatus Aminicenantes bacterium]